MGFPAVGDVAAQLHAEIPACKVVGGAIHGDASGSQLDRTVDFQARLVVIERRQSQAAVCACDGAVDDGSIEGVGDGGIISERDRSGGGCVAPQIQCAQGPRIM